MSKIATMTDVSSCNTIDMVLSASGTDWEPQVVQAHAGGFSAEGWSALVNPTNGAALGFVTGRYRANSHAEQLRALQPLLDGGTLAPVRVSQWDGGGTLAFQFRAPSLETEIAEGRTVSSLLTLAFTHTGKGSDMSFFSDINWFCKNQMGRVNAAVSENGDRVRHRAFVKERYADLVASMVEDMLGASAYRFSRMRQMSRQTLAGARLADFFRAALRLPDANEERTSHQERALAALLSDYATDDAGAFGSVWHALNGVTRYLTHTQGRSADVRSKRLLVGEGVSELSRVWELADNLAG